MRPTNVGPTLNALSAPRLSSYSSYFATADSHDLYSCYQWNGELSRSLLPLLHLIEVTLRNSLHRELSHHFAASRTTGSSTSNNWYNHRPIQLSPKSIASLNKITRKTTRPDDVISRLTFGFWPNLFDCTGIPWGTVLPLVLPHSGRNFAHLKNVDLISTRLHMINGVRNRIAHWEPLWKFGPLAPEKKPRAGAGPLPPTAPATTTPSESIVRMTTLYDRMVSLLSMMDTDVGQTHKDSYAHEHFSWVCSEAGLAAYRAGTKNKELPLSKVRRDLRQLIKNNELVTITAGTGKIARLYPL